jgi:hypothetical protein
MDERVYMGEEEEREVRDLSLFLEGVVWMSPILSAGTNFPMNPSNF